MSADKSQLIDLKKPLSRNYREYFLKYNPFPSTGVPDDTPAFTVDRESIIKKFQNTIFEILESQNTVLTVLVGENGSGKSHILRLFKHNINAQLLEDQNGMLAAYVKNPGREFFDLYKLMIDDIGKYHLAKIVSNYITNFIKSYDNFKRDVPTSIYSDYMDGKIDIEKVLDKSQFLNIAKIIYKKNFSEIPNSDMVNALLVLAHPDLSPLGWQWLMGEKLDQSEKNSIGVNRSIDSKNVYSTFHEFVKAINILGIKYFALFVDELEEITKLFKTKIDAYHNDLRQLIDDNPKNMCLYFAITPQHWEKLLGTKSALVRRLTNWDIIEEFEEKDTRELIERYLFIGRVNGFTSKECKEKFSDCEPSLCPFTEEAVSAIHDKTKGVVSKVITLCRTIVENKSEGTNISAVTESEVKNLKIRL